MVATVLASNELSGRARQLLRYAQRGGKPVAMGSPPAITSGTSATITGGTTLPFSDTKLSYLGTAYSTVGTPGNIAGPGHVDYNGQLAGYRNGTVWSVAFSTDAPAFEWRTFAAGGKYRIFVNDQAVSLSQTALASSFADTYIKIDFGASAPRNIRIEQDGPGLVNTIAIAANYGIWKTNFDDIRAMIAGDSYVAGQYGDGTLSGPLGLGQQVGFNLGIRDWYVSGASGEGYLNLGTQTGKTLRGRSQTDIINYAPRYMMVAYGANDFSKTASAVQTEVATLYSTLLAALPNTIFTVVGPWRAPTISTPQAIYDAIKAGVQAQAEYRSDNTGRIAYIDPFAENWQQVAGRVGATSGTGNSNNYIGADGGHPIQAGHDYLAGRITDAAIRHLTALAG